MTSMTKVHAVSEKVSRFLAKPKQLFIGGAWVESLGGELLSIENPSTGKIIVETAAANKDDVDRAVASARSAFERKLWTGKKYTERGEILWRWSDLIGQEIDALAEIETLDNGMPNVLAKAMIQSGINTIRYYAGMCSKIYGRTSEISGDGLEYHAFSIAEPIGVAALIVPWNAPFATAATKVSSALAAGCSVVLKPAEQTPLSALYIAELAAQAGVPDGVFNVVTGLGTSAGAALACHPDVDKISFTGSTAVGKTLIAASAGNLKRLSLELGGKSPVFVFDDADLEKAIPAAAMGIFANSGQVCYAGSRLYVQRGIHDEVVKGIARIAKEMRVGDGFDPNAQLGPLISAKQLERVLSYVASGTTEGAELVTGGRRPSSIGYFLEPTVFSQTQPGMTIAREEIFGPVLSVASFDKFDEIATIGNGSQYGLGAGIYTTDIGKAHRAVKLLKAGNVWVNCYGFTDKSLPFGGYKQSGWGREGGVEGIEAFLEKKAVYIKL